MNNARPAQAGGVTVQEPAVTDAPALSRPSFWQRLTGSARERDRLLPLYEAVVAAGRDPFWYRDAAVPDTVTGRFDVLAALMALVLLRFEREEGETARQDAVWLTETFVADMDESLHQIGIGDYVVGKHVGAMMGALGGRLGAFRQAAQDRDYAGPVRRNLHHDEPPSDVVVAAAAARLERFASALAGTSLAELVAGRLPRP